MPARAVLSEKGMHSAQQWYPQKNKRSVQTTKCQLAVSHFQLQIFEARPVNTGALQIHPTEGTLFSDSINTHLGAGVEELQFCKFKK